MSAVHARALPEAGRSQPGVYNLYGLRAACRGWSVRSCRDKQEVRCRTCLNMSRLRYGCQRCTLAVAQPALPCTMTFNFREIFMPAFKIYGIWMQADRHTHTSCNAIPLVWGSLRLAPITDCKSIK